MTLRTQRVQTLVQVRRVAEGTEPVDFALAERASAYDFIGRTLVQFDYAALDKADEGAVKAYLGKMTGLSRAQLTRLMAQHRSTGRIRDRRSGGPSRPFARRYTAADVRLLAKVDTALGLGLPRLCGAPHRRATSPTWPGRNAIPFGFGCPRSAPWSPEIPTPWRCGYRAPAPTKACSGSWYNG